MVYTWRKAWTEEVSLVLSSVLTDYFLNPLFKVYLLSAEYAQVLLVLTGAANVQDTEKIGSLLTANKYVEVWCFKLLASHVISIFKFICLIPSGYEPLFVTVERCA